MELWVTHNEFEADLPARCVDMDDFKGACECPKIPTTATSINIT